MLCVRSPALSAMQQSFAKRNTLRGCPEVCRVCEALLQGATGCWSPLISPINMGFIEENRQTQTRKLPAECPQFPDLFHLYFT